MTDVHYDGGEADRANIEISDDNISPTNVTWHYAKPVVVADDVNGDGKVINRDLGLLQQFLTQ